MALFCTRQTRWIGFL